MIGNKLFSSWTWTELSNCSKVDNRAIRVIYASSETCFAARIALYRKTSYSGVTKGSSFSYVQDKRHSSPSIDKLLNSILFNGVISFNLKKQYASLII